MNIFTVLSTGKSNLHEPSISAMFAYLLDYTQDHGLGRKVIDSFLQLANIHGAYQNFIENPNIRFEIDLEVQYTHLGKRNDIDIQIKVLDSSNYELHRIIIENKIKQGAANPKQLNNYYQAVIENDSENDDSFELSKEQLSVIFLTPQPNKGLQDEFDNLDINNKSWLYWNSNDTENITVVNVIQDILKLEQEAKISPINEYTRHTLKAFTYYIIKTIEASSGKNRVGENIGDIVKTREIDIENDSYTIILRNSGQIQLFNQEGDKIPARPLLRIFLQENNIKAIYGDRANTRQIGKQIFDYLEH